MKYYNCIRAEGGLNGVMFLMVFFVSFGLLGQEFNLQKSETIQHVEDPNKSVSLQKKYKDRLFEARHDFKIENVSQESLTDYTGKVTKITHRIDFCSSEFGSGLDKLKFTGYRSGTVDTVGLEAGIYTNGIDFSVDLNDNGLVVRHLRGDLLAKISLTKLAAKGKIKYTFQKPFLQKIVGPTKATMSTEIGVSVSIKPDKIGLFRQLVKGKEEIFGLDVGLDFVAEEVNMHLNASLFDLIHTLTTNPEAFFTSLFSKSSKYFDLVKERAERLGSEYPDKMLEKLIEEIIKIEVEESLKQFKTNIKGAKITPIFNLKMNRNLSSFLDLAISLNILGDVALNIPSSKKSKTLCDPNPRKPILKLNEALSKYKLYSKILSQKIKIKDVTTAINLGSEKNDVLPKFESELTKFKNEMRLPMFEDKRGIWRIYFDTLDEESVEFIARNLLRGLKSSFSTTDILDMVITMVHNLASSTLDFSEKVYDAVLGSTFGSVPVLGDKMNAIAGTAFTVTRKAIEIHARIRTFVSHNIVGNIPILKDMGGVLSKGLSFIAAGIEKATKVFSSGFCAFKNFFTRGGACDKSIMEGGVTTSKWGHIRFYQTVGGQQSGYSYATGDKLEETYTRPQPFDMGNRAEMLKGYYNSMSHYVWIPQSAPGFLLDHVYYNKSDQRQQNNLCLRVKPINRVAKILVDSSGVTKDESLAKFRDVPDNVHLVSYNVGKARANAYHPRQHQCQVAAVYAPVTYLDIDLSESGLAYLFYDYEKQLYDSHQGGDKIRPIKYEEGVKKFDLLLDQLGYSNRSVGKQISVSPKNKLVKLVKRSTLPIRKHTSSGVSRLGLPMVYGEQEGYLNPTSLSSSTWSKRYYDVGVNFEYYGERSEKSDIWDNDPDSHLSLMERVKDMNYRLKFTPKKYRNLTHLEVNVLGKKHRVDLSESGQKTVEVSWYDVFKSYTQNPVFKGRGHQSSKTLFWYIYHYQDFFFGKKGHPMKEIIEREFYGKTEYVEQVLSLLIKPRDRLGKTSVVICKHYNAQTLECDGLLKGLTELSISTIKLKPIYESIRPIFDMAKPTIYSLEGQTEKLSSFRLGVLEQSYMNKGKMRLAIVNGNMKEKKEVKHRFISKEELTYDTAQGSFSPNIYVKYTPISESTIPVLRMVSFHPEFTDKSVDTKNPYKDPQSLLYKQYERQEVQVYDQLPVYKRITPKIVERYTIDGSYSYSVAKDVMEPKGDFALSLDLNVVDNCELPLVCNWEKDWDSGKRYTLLSGRSGIHRLYNKQDYKQRISLSNRFSMGFDKGDLRTFSQSVHQDVSLDKVYTSKQLLDESGIFYGPVELSWNRPTVKGTEVTVNLRAKSGYTVKGFNKYAAYLFVPSVSGRFIYRKIGISNFGRGTDISMSYTSRPGNNYGYYMVLPTSIELPSELTLSDIESIDQAVFGKRFSLPSPLQSELRYEPYGNPLDNKRYRVTSLQILDPSFGTGAWKVLDGDRVLKQGDIVDIPTTHRRLRARPTLDTTRLQEVFGVSEVPYVSVVHGTGAASSAVHSYVIDTIWGYSYTRLTYSTEARHPMQIGGYQGHIRIKIDGGESPYRVQIKGPNGYSKRIDVISIDEPVEFQGLLAGDYLIEVRDKYGIEYSSISPSSMLKKTVSLIDPKKDVLPIYSLGSPELRWSESGYNIWTDVQVLETILHYSNTIEKRIKGCPDRLICSWKYPWSGQVKSLEMSTPIDFRWLSTQAYPLHTFTHEDWLELRFNTTKTDLGKGTTTSRIAPVGVDITTTTLGLKDSLYYGPVEIYWEKAQVSSGLGQLSMKQGEGYYGAKKYLSHQVYLLYPLGSDKLGSVQTSVSAFAKGAHLVAQYRVSQENTHAYYLVLPKGHKFSGRDWVSKSSLSDIGHVVFGKRIDLPREVSYSISYEPYGNPLDDGRYKIRHKVIDPTFGMGAWKVLAGDIDLQEQSLIKIPSYNQQTTVSVHPYMDYYRTSTSMGLHQSDYVRFHHLSSPMNMESVLSYEVSQIPPYPYRRLSMEIQKRDLMEANGNHGMLRVSFRAGEAPYKLSVRGPKGYQKERIYQTAQTEVLLEGLIAGNYEITLYDRFGLSHPERSPSSIIQRRVSIHQPYEAISPSLRVNTEHLSITNRGYIPETDEQDLGIDVSYQVELEQYVKWCPFRLKCEWLDPWPQGKKKVSIAKRLDISSVLGQKDIEIGSIVQHSKMELRHNTSSFGKQLRVYKNRHYNKQLSSVSLGLRDSIFYGPIELRWEQVEVSGDSNGQISIGSSMGYAYGSQYKSYEVYLFYPVSDTDLGYVKTSVSAFKQGNKIEIEYNYYPLNNYAYYMVLPENHVLGTKATVSKRALLGSKGAVFGKRIRIPRPLEIKLDYRPWGNPLDNGQYKLTTSMNASSNNGSSWDLQLGGQKFQGHLIPIPKEPTTLSVVPMMSSTSAEQDFEVSGVDYVHYIHLGAMSHSSPRPHCPVGQVLPYRYNQLILEVEGTHLVQNKKNNGSIRLYIRGGEPPYKLHIQSDKGYSKHMEYAELPTDKIEISDLASGRYTIVLRDKYGINQEALSPSSVLKKTIAITEPNMFEIYSLETQNIQKKGANNGRISLKIKGGTPPYRYVLQDENNRVLYQKKTNTKSIELDSLKGGKYTITVSDVHGPSMNSGKTTYSDVLVSSVYLREPAQFRIKNLLWRDPDPRLSNGRLSLEISGGAPVNGVYYILNMRYRRTANLPYKTLMSNVYTVSRFEKEGLSLGYYELTIKDMNGNLLESKHHLVERYKPLNISLTVLTPRACYSGAKGKLSVEIQGGYVPSGEAYSIVWYKQGTKGRERLNTNIKRVEELSAGVYTVEVSDHRGEKVEKQAEIASIEPLRLNTWIDHPSGDTSQDGLISISPVSGQSPYSYLWESHPKLNGSAKDDLLAGRYKIKITDAQGCEARVDTELKAKTSEVPLVVTGSSHQTAISRKPRPIIERITALPNPLKTASLHPIPASNYITLRVVSQQAIDFIFPIQIQIYDLYGSMSKEVSINTHADLQSAIDIQQLPPSQYFAIMTDSKGRTKRLQFMKI